MCRYSHKLLNTWRIIAAGMIVVSLLYKAATSQNETVEPVEPQVIETFTFAGQVVNEDGEPLAGAEVFISSRVPDSSPSVHKMDFEIRTDENGRFIFQKFYTDVKLTFHDILAMYPGLSIGGTHLGNTPDLENMVIMLHNSVSVSGVVRSMNGDPLKGASV